MSLFGFFCLFYRPQLNIEESKITIEMKLVDFSHQKKKVIVYERIMEK